jgi:glycosyltransferase involved in cell wall biosynthesis
MKTSYIPKNKRKKILLLGDDLRMHSGVATMLREIVTKTSNHFNWLQLAGAINHPEQGKRFDLSQATEQQFGVKDAEVIVIPINGYGNPQMIRDVIKAEKPDVLMMMTDPRYYVWLFQIENEVRKHIPIVYLNIWDDYPAPLYNEDFYKSCDGFAAISKQTKNINRIVLGDDAKNKVIKYVPHGIDHQIFRPITESDEDWKNFQAYKKRVLGDKEYDFVWYYNARNIRRKQTSDMFAAWNQFCEHLGPEKAKKCCFLLHTQISDENGTNLGAVKDLLVDEEKHGDIIFWDHIVSPQEMNFLYNMSDLTSLLSSNEGWGLSLTEAMMCGKMIMATVTGGMQDQMRFTDKNGNWIDFDDDFCSNHFGTYKTHGEWVIPIYPACMSIQGSVPTPYIFDDRCDFRDAAKGLIEVFEMSKEERNRRGMLGREWVTSDEAMMTAENMAKNMADCINETLANFKPRKPYTFIKVEELPKKKLRHKLVY